MKVKLTQGGKLLDPGDMRRLTDAIKGKVRLGSVRLGTLLGLAGTILTVATITDIITDSFSHLDCELIADTQEGNCKTCVWECTHWEKSGFLGLGPLQNKGKILVVHEIPIDKNPGAVCPKTKRPTLQNLQDPVINARLRNLGVREYFIPLPE
jgi:hypothetical protein